MLEWEESLTTESIQKMIREEVQKELANHKNELRKLWRTFQEFNINPLNRQMQQILKDINASPLESLIDSNDAFLNEIKPVLEHIRDYEQKIYKEMQEIRKKCP